MDANKLFAAALQLGSEWKVSRSELSAKEHTLKIWLDFQQGHRFPCPECRRASPVHDTVEKRWRHMNFWQYRTELIARVPRIDCPEHGVRLVEVPWARAGSGFTLMMEAVILMLSREMSVSAMAEMLKEQDTRLWRVLGHYVEKAYRREDWSEVKKILVDETSSKRGHRYVTVVTDAESRKLLFLAEGRGKEALEAFAKEMKEHNADPGQIEAICMDMSPSYISGAREFFPKAERIFDHFHVMQMAGEAVDQVRKEFGRQGLLPKGSLWALRGNEWTRSEEQKGLRSSLCAAYPRLGRAIGLREALQEILSQEDPQELRWWFRWADRSRLAPFRRLSKTIKEHLGGIIAFLQSRITNGTIEAINGLIQLAKRMARGFRSFRYLRIAAFLKAGKLRLDLPALPT
ncbi:ISL3 family transposase [Methylacidimicrobium sp. B4]|uniref:ISL3 family transposase n=1 Tax=Methylacidimicrobium sp. B4 TaxID=2796139 RepID=UPI001A8F47C5|nr:ISL3 family transposase [Methylacidimicrobium sp. B4]QSR85243.1 ISL3 family transposase [Methylacidimicrobium sp. B4]